MIRAWIFDLDGTLVQTERLKALSYARAAVDLCPYEITEGQVTAAFKDVVGRPRREVAQFLVEKFSLQEAASEHMTRFGVQTPWQAYIQIRLEHYDAMISDAGLLREHQWPHNIALLNAARQEGCRTALATMSRCQQATTVLQALGLEHAFDFIASRDDVERGKPDPEIYELVVEALTLPVEECLVIEDSPAGVESALAAGLDVIAVATDFTRKRLHESGLLPEAQIVDEPERLVHVVRAWTQTHQRKVHEDG
jgi:HAD superfamily hydrolase (TIGR01509 family)